MSERTAEEWGRVAVALPGWRWMPGMRDLLTGERMSDEGGLWVCDESEQGHPWRPQCRPPGEDSRPDLDDPATAGCLLALLCPSDREGYIGQVQPPRHDGEQWRIYMRLASGDFWGAGATLGRACIAAAEALGRWPGGGQ